ncbi:MAG TPA: DUF6289 family protein [Thermoanaerobaculia bacterium]|nr:DUF6289 family protein [Thermoanaerobaculia bacterium]
MKKFAVAFGFIALLTVGAVSSMQALPSTSYDDVFFSDNTFSEPVGERYSQCGGGVYSWGYRTPYVEQTTYDCQTNDMTGCSLYECGYCPDWAWNINQCTGCSTFADC